MSDIFSTWPGARAAFPDGDVLFVSDKQYVVEILSERGLPAEHLAELPNPPESVVLVGCDYATLGPSVPLHELFQNSRVLWVPLVSFDPQPAAARYSIDLMLSSDLAAATKRNRDWTSILRRIRRPLTINSAQSSLNFQLIRDDQIILDTRLEPRIDKGEFVSIALYFEVDIDGSGMPEGDPFYAVNGTFWADGLVVARHPDLELDSPHMSAARTIAAQVTWAGGIRLEIVDSKIISAICDGREIADSIVACTGKYGSQLTEFSFGTNNDVAASLDWSVNSQLNEGASGVHIGVGEGVTGAHIDFVLPGAEVRFAA